MSRLKNILLTTLIVICSSCNSQQDNTYAIKDLRESLQPFLLNIVSKGFVTRHDKTAIKKITDDELILLSKSENPILRATSLEEMLDRKSFDDFNIVMDHLDDTAIVATDQGEFGIWFKTVTDHIILEAAWETYPSRSKTIEEVLTKHNYLRSAYIILDQLAPQEKYYPYIKDMASRPRQLSDEGYELGFDDIEYALYGLAKFKKPNDIKIIKEKLIQHTGKLSDVSFRLMSEFPYTAYLEVLQKYHDIQFYQFSGIRPHGFSGFNADRAAPEDFIRALVVQQNDESAKLLDTMLTYLPKRKCMPDKENIINKIIMEIWEHPCLAYTTLREKIRPQAEENLKGYTTIEMDKFSLSDTSKKIIRWFD